MYIIWMKWNKSVQQHLSGDAKCFFMIHKYFLSCSWLKTADFTRYHCVNECWNDLENERFQRLKGQKCPKHWNELHMSNGLYQGFIYNQDHFALSFSLSTVIFTCRSHSHLPQSLPRSLRWRTTWRTRWKKSWRIRGTLGWASLCASRWASN